MYQFNYIDRLINNLNDLSNHHNTCYLFKDQITMDYDHE